MTALTVRKLLIDLNTPFAPRWNGGDAFRSAFFNALSMSFPIGEQYFIDSVRAGLKALPDEKRAQLSAEVQGFVGQEATHRRIHALFNGHLERQGHTNTLEPRAAHPEKRLAAVRALAAAGVQTFVNIAPVVPAITDHELEAIVERAAQAGAHGAYYMIVRLPHEVAPLFRAWLEAHYPERAGKVMTIIRDIRGGRDNNSDFHARMRGEGVWAELFRVRFRKALARYGLGHKTLDVRSDLFRRPDASQPSLF